MRTYYLNSTLYNKLYSVMQYPNALALRVSLESGMRIGDVLALEAKQIDGRTVTYTAQKTGKKGKAVLSQDLANRLKQISGKKWIFEGRFGDKPRLRQTVWKDVKKAAKTLKLHGNIAPHTARKTYAVETFAESGIGTVQKQLQHNDVNTTMLYAFADMIDRVPAARLPSKGRTKSDIEKDDSTNSKKSRQTFEGTSCRISPQGLTEDTINTISEAVADRVVLKLLQCGYFSRSDK